MAIWRRRLTLLDRPARSFSSLSAESAHQVTWLFGSCGIPPSYRHMDGFSSLTHQWLNANNEVFRVKYHCKTDQGIECMTVEDAIRIAGRRYHHRDLMHAIGRAEFPSWTLKM